MVAEIWLDRLAVLNGLNFEPKVSVHGCNNWPVIVRLYEIAKSLRDLGGD